MPPNGRTTGTALDSEGSDRAETGVGAAFRSSGVAAETAREGRLRLRTSTRFGRTWRTFLGGTW
jgi:hypothetical protein